MRDLTKTVSIGGIPWGEGETRLADLGNAFKAMILAGEIIGRDREIAALQQRQIADRKRLDEMTFPEPKLHSVRCRCDGRGIVPNPDGPPALPCPETEPT